MKMPDPVDKVAVAAPQSEEVAPVISPAMTGASTGVATTGTVEAAHHPERERDDMTVFFGIGIVVNLTMFTLLVIWGFNQWKKNDERKK